MCEEMRRLNKINRSNAQNDEEQIQIRILQEMESNRLKGSRLSKHKLLVENVDELY